MLWSRNLLGNSGQVNRHALANLVILLIFLLGEASNDSQEVK